GQLAIARRALRQIAQRALGLQRLLAHVVAAHARRARAGLEEARDHAHGGGLAGAVGAQQPEHLARFGAETQRVHRREGTIASSEQFGFDHVLWSQSRASAARMAAGSTRTVTESSPGPARAGPENEKALPKKGP